MYRYACSDHGTILLATPMVTYGDLIQLLPPAVCAQYRQRLNMRAKVETKAGRAFGTLDCEDRKPYAEEPEPDHVAQI